MWFVGRQDELSALRAEAEAVRANGTRFVLVTGEIGVGKSALAARFAEQLAIEGFNTARTVCASIAGMPPLRPWQLLLRGLAPVKRPGSTDTTTHAHFQCAPTAAGISCRGVF